MLNNTEVKGHHSTICRHACFGILQLISAAWYTSTHVSAWYLYTWICSHQAHAVQHNTTDTRGHAQSVIGPECSNDLKGSGLCIIAIRHLLIYIYIFPVYFAYTWIRGKCKRCWVTIFSLIKLCFLYNLLISRLAGRIISRKATATKGSHRKS